LGPMSNRIRSSQTATNGHPGGLLHEWNDGDYDVIADGVAVGRIMKALTAPVGSPWFGTLAYGFHRKRNPTHVGAELRARCSGENVFDLHLCHSPLWASIRGNDDRHQAEIACLAFARCVVFRGETGDRCRVTR